MPEAAQRRHRVPPPRGARGPVDVRPFEIETPQQPELVEKRRVRRRQRTRGSVVDGACRYRGGRRRAEVAPVRSANVDAPAAAGEVFEIGRRRQRGVSAPPRVEPGGIALRHVQVQQRRQRVRGVVVLAVGAPVDAEPALGIAGGVAVGDSAMAVENDVHQRRRRVVAGRRGGARRSGPLGEPADDEPDGERAESERAQRHRAAVQQGQHGDGDEGGGDRDRRVRAAADAEPFLEPDARVGERNQEVRRRRQQQDQNGGSHGAARVEQHRGEQQRRRHEGGERDEALGACERVAGGLQEPGEGGRQDQQRRRAVEDAFARRACRARASRCHSAGDPAVPKRRRP